MLFFFFQKKLKIGPTDIFLEGQRLGFTPFELTPKVHHRLYNMFSRNFGSKSVFFNLPLVKTGRGHTFYLTGSTNDDERQN